MNNIVEAIAYSKETGKKYFGSVNISEEALRNVKTELLEEKFCFEENGIKLNTSIVILKKENNETIDNPEFSQYIQSLIS